MKLVTTSDIKQALGRLGILGKHVVVHSSLSSFGKLEGGCSALISILIESLDTVMMPAFCFSSNAQPPADDRLELNGTDYTYYENWNRPPTPFDLSSMGVDERMGVVARQFAKLPETRRSEHAWHSWAANGNLSKYLVENHSWDTTNLPIERLAKKEGYLLLIGVSLTSCTAVHVAEERAGRAPFVRWAVDKDGIVQRVRAAGCANGFDNIFQPCEDLFSVENVGQCKLIAAPLEPFIERAASLISEQPEITRCSESCLRCADAIKGGPRLESGRRV